MRVLAAFTSGTTATTVDGDKRGLCGRAGPLLVAQLTNASPMMSHIFQGQSFRQDRLRVTGYDIPMRFLLSCCSVPLGRGKLVAPK